MLRARYSRIGVTFRFVPLITLASFGLGLGAQGQTADPSALFRERVQPLLIQRCLECHGGAGKGGLDLRTREGALKGGEHGPALVPGDATKSPLVHRAFMEEMPPKNPLSDEEVDTLDEWVRAGAPYPDGAIDMFAMTTERRAGYDWWSLQPLRNPAVPPVDDAVASGTVSVAWTENPVDHFIADALRAKGLIASGPASPRALIRRATYDLTGLAPSPEETAEFVRQCAAETGREDDVGDRAYAALIDRLLASPAYGEQWGRHWLDIVRFGESLGFEVNELMNDAWPYRDYVIQSFNEDKPFDRFVLEQIAGDSLAPGDPAVEVGLTLLSCGPIDIVGNQDPVQAKQIRANTIDDIVRVTGETFLGLTVGCARCHDHKFDPIATKDYYRLQATFAGVFPESREVATQAQRDTRAQALAPLEARRAELSAQRSAVEETILARAAAKAAEFETRWSRPPVARTGTTEEFAPVEARAVRLVVSGRDKDPYSSTGFKIDEFEVWTADGARNVALASAGGHADGRSPVAEDFGGAYLPELTIDGKFGQSWIASAPILTITLAQPERISKVLFSSDRLGALAPDSGEAPFPCEYRVEVSADGHTWTQVADSSDRKPANDAHRRKRQIDAEISPDERTRLDEIAAADREVGAQMAALPKFAVLHVGRVQQPTEAMHVYLGGDPQRLGDEVAPESPKMIKACGEYALASDAPEAERRLALAKWIVAPENPLPARVLANRIWHYHFGTGIVSTPSDFGFMGSPPSHPELLDWLARQLVAPDAAGDAWRLKRMHKLIMMSQTYRQSGEYRKDAADVDGEARLLWRFPPRRLSGEEIRDAMLQTAGVLNRQMGGPGYRLYKYIRDNVASYIPLDEYSADTYRRSVYHQNARASRIDLMTDFDAPDCAMAAPRRVNTTTPIQSLTLMNHRFTLDMAQAAAARVESDAGRKPEAQVRRAFDLAFGREPSKEETREAVDLVKDAGLRALFRAIFNSNEFVYLD